MVEKSTHLKKKSSSFFFWMNLDTIFAGGKINLIFFRNLKNRLDFLFGKLKNSLDFWWEVGNLLDVVLSVNYHKRMFF